MKKSLITLLFLLTVVTSRATVYYVSSTGNDGDNGTSEGTAWQTLSKVSGYTFSAGDQVLFKKGDIFYGTLTIGQSGTSGSRIIYGSYGTGANPIISGFTAVTAWTNLGSNIWESTNAVSTLSTLNMVVIGTTNTPMGREPDTGYYYFQSHSGNTSITSNNLTGTPNWTGAEIAICYVPYSISRKAITSQSGSTLIFSAVPYIVQDNEPFIIQNDARTLDVQNEWYYNPTTKKLKVYSTSQPSNVKVSTVETLVSVGTNYVTIQYIDFTGSNIKGIATGGCNYLTVQNCNFTYNGASAISSSWASVTGVNVNNCTFTNTNTNGIVTSPVGTSATIKANTFTNTGSIYGAGVVSEGWDIGVGTAIHSTGTGSLIEENSIMNVGYVGIRFYGSNTTVQKNFIDNFCTNLHDGGGIYTWNGEQATITNSNILNNIIIGYHNDGTPADDDMDGCIYLDDYSNGILIQGNTCIGSDFGIFLHEAHHIDMNGNTTFNNDAGIRTYGLPSPFYMTNLTIQNNIILAKQASQRTVHFDPLEKVLPTFTASNNIYARPVNEGATVGGYNRTPSFSSVLYTVANWKTFTTDDAGTVSTPFTVSNINELYIAYNNSLITSSVPLTASYKELDGTVHASGSISLGSFSSKVLFYTGEIQQGGDAAPVVTSFILPTTSDTLHVTITTFTATDDIAVTHYAVSESSTPPAVDSPIWNVSVPTSYNFTQYGYRTLYAWTKDISNNISSPTSDMVYIYPQYLIPHKRVYRNTRDGNIYKVNNNRISLQ